MVHVCKRYHDIVRRTFVAPELLINLIGQDGAMISREGKETVLVERVREERLS